MSENGSGGNVAASLGVVGNSGSLVILVQVVCSCLRHLRYPRSRLLALNLLLRRRGQAPEAGAGEEERDRERVFSDDVATRSYLSLYSTCERVRDHELAVGAVNPLYSSLTPRGYKNGI